ncbi:hypothetical protein [Eubacterium maltosivorans]|uniref:hypothetical protein n=1 Tax=Eubacterium maltosivorans TaxID=2041044 RepID=UPI00189C9292|nr:hypothetical protein [Eubacterium maltosivorans]
MKKKFTALLLAFALILVLSSCSNNIGNIDGTWVADSGDIIVKFDGDNFSIARSANEKLTSEASGTYRLDGEKMTIQYPDGSTEDSICKISGDGLKLKINNVLLPFSRSDVSYDDILKELGASGNEEIPVEVEYDNTAKETTLSTGNFVVGVDVSPGRYKVTANEGTGFFNFVDSSFGSQSFALFSGAAPYNSIEVYLNEGGNIKIDGLTSVSLEPKNPSIRSNFGSGIYIVGTDIEPGTYDISAQGSIGNIAVDSPSASSLKINEILGGEDGVQNVKTPLVNGDTIYIEVTKSIKFSKID